MNTRVEAIAFASWALLSLAGCGGWLAPAGVAGARVSSMPSHVVELTRHLAAADDEEDELGGLLAPPAEVVAPLEVASPPRRPGKLGLRGGVLITRSADAGDFDPATLVGAFYRRGRIGEGTVHEIGVGQVSLEGEDAGGNAVSSSIVSLRYGLLAGRGRRTGLYLACGAEVGFEKASWVATETEVSRTGVAASVGFGLGSVSGSWDARLSYVLYPASDNAREAIMATLGIGF